MYVYVCVCDKLGMKDVSNEEFKYDFFQYVWKFSQGHNSERQFIFGCKRCGMFALKDWLFYSYYSKSLWS